MKRIVIGLLMLSSCGQIDASFIKSLHEDSLKTIQARREEYLKLIKQAIESDVSGVYSMQKLSALSYEDFLGVIRYPSLDKLQFDDLEQLDDLIVIRQQNIKPIVTDEDYKIVQEKLAAIAEKNVLTLRDVAYAFYAMQARYESSVNVTPTGTKAQNVMMNGSKKIYQKILLYFQIALSSFVHKLQNRRELQELAKILIRVAVTFFDVKIEKKTNLISSQINDGDVQKDLNKALRNINQDGSLRTRRVDQLVKDLNTMLPLDAQIKDL